MESRQRCHKCILNSKQIKLGSVIDNQWRIDRHSWPHPEPEQHADLPSVTHGGFKTDLPHLARICGYKNIIHIIIITSISRSILPPLHTSVRGCTSRPGDLRSLCVEKTLCLDSLVQLMLFRFSDDFWRFESIHPTSTWLQSPSRQAGWILVLVSRGLVAGDDNRKRCVLSQSLQYRRKPVCGCFLSIFLEVYKRCGSGDTRGGRQGYFEAVFGRIYVDEARGSSRGRSHICELANGAWWAHLLWHSNTSSIVCFTQSIGSHSGWDIGSHRTGMGSTILDGSGSCQWKIVPVPIAVANRNLWERFSEAFWYCVLI